jgi:hypothetical protein
MPAPTGAIGTFGLTAALISAAEPVPSQTGSGYETTGEYDDNLDYDKASKPACLFWFCIMARTAGAKLPSTHESKPKLKKSPHFGRRVQDMIKTNEYDDDLHYDKFPTCLFIHTIIAQIGSPVYQISSNLLIFLKKSYEPNLRYPSASVIPPASAGRRLRRSRRIWVASGSSRPRCFTPFSMTGGGEWLSGQALIPLDAFS